MEIIQEMLLSCLLHTRRRSFSCVHEVCGDIPCVAIGLNWTPMFEVVSYMARFEVKNGHQEDYYVTLHDITKQFWALRI